MASWPARGSDADSPTLLRAIQAAWLSEAGGSSLAPPGEVVEPLYLGSPDGSRVGLARSRTDDGRLLVVAAKEDSTGWRVLDVVEVASDVSWLVLPGSDPPRVLAAPDVAAAGSLLLRRDDGVWTRAAIRDDGVTGSLRSIDRLAPILGVLGSVGAGRGLVDVATLSRTSGSPSSHLSAPTRHAGAARRR